MTRRNFGVVLFAAIMGLVTFFVSTSSVQAQNQKCCTYTVIAKGISDKCLPFTVKTYWSTGTDKFSIPAVGVYVRKVPPPCPPPPDFKAVTLDDVTFVGLGQQAKFLINGCCYLVDAHLDNNSCVEILITPC